MATIKSYTDLSQSKTLSKILPLESADMHYSKDFDCSWFVDLAKYTSVKIPKYVGNIEEHLLPCWSLAALLDVIPEIINFDDDESDYALEILIENGLYYLSYGNPFEHNRVEIEPQENFVDACYEMILKLHELKLL